MNKEVKLLGFALMLSASFIGGAMGGIYYKSWDETPQAEVVQATGQMVEAFTAQIGENSRYIHCWGLWIDMSRVKYLEATRDQCLEFIEVMVIGRDGEPIAKMTYDEFERRMK